MIFYGRFSAGSGCLTALWDFVTSLHHLTGLPLRSHPACRKSFEHSKLISPLGIEALRLRRYLPGSRELLVLYIPWKDHANHPYCLQLVHQHTLVFQSILDSILIYRAEFLSYVWRKLKMRTAGLHFRNGRLLLRNQEIQQFLWDCLVHGELFRHSTNLIQKH